MGNLEDQKVFKKDRETFDAMVDAHSAWRTGTGTAEQVALATEAYLVQITSNKINVGNQYKVV